MLGVEPTPPNGVNTFLGNFSTISKGRYGLTWTLFMHVIDPVER